MKIVANIQARMSSSRLPKKVLLKIGKELVLERIINRLNYCRYIDEILVATSVCESDNCISKYCESAKISCFRGSLDDVLDRYYQAAKMCSADAVVRITGDCPLIDPVVVDKVIDHFICGEFDAVGLHGEFPDGLDCQVFSFSAIKKAWCEATSDTDREHVGSFIENTSPHLFKLGTVEIFKNLGHHRWTLDEPCDLEYLKLLIEGLEESKQLFLSEDVLKFLEQNKHLMKINGAITRNEGYLLSKERESLNEKNL